QELEFIEKQNDWYHVSFQGYDGWVASWLTSSKNKVEQSSTNTTIISQVNHLNIRSEPNISSPVLGQLDIGNEATVL
ncbi:SH3 domain-containing protein, partial [Brevibacterium sp. SIMBA_078]|uniref:SH3 domain-containing protein n=1 Tax=Brevibacterium sp. SIMBA_078 TaxID=3085816 RepID=UPI00397B2F97